MKVTEIKNGEGNISGIMIPVSDFSEIRDSVKEGTRFYNYLQELLSSSSESDEDQEILSNGRTITETNRLSASLAGQIYAYAFEKDVAMFYRDDRSLGEHEFIRANPDGSEDLIEFDIETRKDTFLRNLLPAGKGQYANLKY